MTATKPSKLKINNNQMFETNFQELITDILEECRAAESLGKKEIKIGYIYSRAALYGVPKDYVEGDVVGIVKNFTAMLKRLSKRRKEQAK